MQCRGCGPTQPSGYSVMAPLHVFLASKACPWEVVMDVHATPDSDKKFCKLVSKCTLIEKKKCLKHATFGVKT